MQFQTSGRGWAEGCGGLGALPPAATPDPAALAERGLIWAKKNSQRKWQPTLGILAWKSPWTEEPGMLQFTGHKESDMNE